MTVSQFIITTSAAVALALPSVSIAEFGVYASLRQSVLFTESALALAANEKTLGVKLKASDATGSNNFLAANNMPLAVASGYQHDLSNRSRGSLKRSSVGPDIAGLDASIEGGVL